MTLNQTILWRRLDAPGHEFAQLFFEDAVWRLTGTAIFAFDNKQQGLRQGPQRRPARLDYLVECGADWQTRSARVSGWVGDETISIEISVDESQRWRLNGVEVPDVEGCVDIDLSFSPSTNLLPIRRLRLNVGDEIAATAAWLRFPNFKLEPLDQSYRRVSNSGYRYESAAGKFVAQLSVNEAGFVTGYPNLWVIEAPA
jgi:uncharacterized protein